ncbi:MAG: histidinol-phosphatase HisJ family protein [Armatimonadetes bacterium]|nr:histidinol-phosphatase HisJ family protein [Armatimonadota bacterium]
MARYDHHMHLERGPFTLAYLRRFVETARRRDIAAIGISEHPHRFRQCRSTYPRSITWIDPICVEDLEEYLVLVGGAREAGLPVKMSMEWDYVPGHEAEVERHIRAYPWDYAIGSVHYIPGNPDGHTGEWWGFDHPDFRAEWERRDVMEAYRAYFRLIQQAAHTGLFHVIGHVDVIKVFGHRPAADLTDLYEETAAVLATSGVCVEVNTAGLHKPVDELYPAPPFLAILRRHGVPVVTSSDAHDPEHVGRDFDGAVAAARAAGYTEVWTFTRGARERVPLE